MKKTVIEAMVLQSLEKVNQEKNRRAILESVCQKNGHIMQYSSLYRCFICSICGHSSDKEKEGYNWEDYH